MPGESFDEDFRVDVGRADGGRTFVRVVHLPTGRERTVVGLDGRTARENADELAFELPRTITSDK